MDTHVYRETWVADFEYTQATGELPSPVCLVARELKSGRVLRVFGEDLLRMERAPFATDKDALFVSYYAPAEISCFLVLGWPVPERIVDCYAEFRNLTNGNPPPHGNGLLGAMAFFGLNCIDVAEKDEMRELAIRGGPYSPDEASALLEYCESDVNGLAALFDRMWPCIDLPRALLRGRYAVAVAKMERNGVPIDVATYRSLEENWEFIKAKLLERADHHGLWENGGFRAARFAAFLRENSIAWPMEGTRLRLDDDTFRSMAASHPIIASVRELRHTLSQLRLNDLAVGTDGRNRCMLSPFRSKTGRNQPSNARFIFGPSVWLRGIIQAPRGYALSYCDWANQEIGIGAGLSSDPAMMEAYACGDPYLEFARQAGAVPPDATKESHPAERTRYKICSLAVQYGMGETSLATKLNEPQAAARELLRLHRQTYRRYWAWNEDLVDSALLGMPLRTAFGWTLHPTDRPNVRSLSNFPMQANGSEMLRLACCMATERGIEVCAPVHDAILVMAETDRIEEVVRDTQAIMAEASTIVLGGRLTLRSDAKIFHHPERYADERGTEMWATVMGILEELGADPA